MKNFILFLKSRAFRLNFAIAFVSITLIMYLVLKWLNVYTKHGETISVPDLKGMDVVEAMDLLDDQGFKYVIDSIYTDQAEPNSVYEQEPEANALVKENRTIFTAIEFSKQNVKFYIIIDKSKIGHAYIFTKKSFYKLLNKPIDSNLSNIENINLNDNLPIPDEENDNIQTPQNIDFVSKYRDNQEKIFENKKYKKRGR